LPLCRGRLRGDRPAARGGRRRGPNLRLRARQGDQRQGRSGGMRAPDVATRALLEVKGLRKHFPITEGVIAHRLIGEGKAVDGIDFTLRRGETLGRVGEGGCGKTPPGRCILLLERPTAGEIIYDGRDLASLPPKELRALRR